MSGEKRKYCTCTFEDTHIHYEGGRVYFLRKCTLNETRCIVVDGNALECLKIARLKRALLKEEMSIVSFFWNKVKSDYAHLSYFEELVFLLIGDCWIRRDKEGHVTFRKWEVKIGRYLRNKCRNKIIGCPYKALLPEYRIVK